MTADEKRVGLRYLSALVWADGKITKDELVRLVEYIAFAGEMSREEVSHVLGEVKTLDELTEAALGKLSDAHLAPLLSFGYDMVNAERPATAAELDLIQRAACARLSPAQWDKIHEWLVTQRRANELYDELFANEEEPFPKRPTARWAE